ncbi:hypothetical protein KY284_030484 [Solanum tuberosum]|nr:hypothetical protein KY284_030484 [Solanum tuberosum]
MENGEAVEVVKAMEEEEVITINSTMKIRVTSHSEVVAVVNEKEEDVKPIKTVNLVDNNKDEDESTLLLAFKEDTDDCSSWYLDNGASNHMCGHKDKFVEIKKTVKGNMSFGDTSKI